MSLLRKLFATPARQGAPTTPNERLDLSAALPRVPGSREQSARIVAEASALECAGRFAQALQLVDSALSKAAGDADLLFAKGSTLGAWGRTREALDALLLAGTHGLNTPAFALQLGFAYLGVGAAGEGERQMRRAIAAMPDEWRAHFGLARALQAQGRLREAIESFERALELHPNERECIVNVGVCRIAQGDPAAGEAQFRRALALAPDSANCWNNLGVALEHQDRHAEAQDAYREATRLEAQTGRPGASYVNLALSLQGEGRTRDALAVLETHLAESGSPEAYGNYAQALRTAGRLPEGWTHFEFRWLAEPMLSDRPAIGRPVWAGQDLRGRTILLRAEQGLGDTLQFIRYAPHVKALGATVLLAVQNPLLELARGFPGVDRVLQPGDALPHVDFYIHLMSLPRVFATGLDSVPADIPYLRADPVRCARWATRLAVAEPLKVGVVWSGRVDQIINRFRSMPLRMLAPLGAVQGVRFFTLQKGPPALEAKAPPPGLALEDLDAELTDLSDTAAAIAQLDVVITICTSVAHLAGALGKPVWLMLATPTEWRWMEEREDTPWYPTVRLFRQRRRGDWTDVVERVKVALQGRVEEALRNAIPAAGPAAQAASTPRSLLPIAKLPREAPGHRAGYCAVAETRHGILQFFPDEPRVGDSIGWYGEYLEAQLERVCRTIPAGAIVLEVGAGVGHHALQLSAAIGPAGHLILAEPRRLPHEVLRRNLAANRIANATLLAPVPIADGATTGLDTLDELQLERLDCLKLNDGVAAGEYLAGAAGTLWRLRPMLFIGAPDERTLMELAGEVKNYGYRVWRMATRLFDPGNFNRRDEDIFAGATALALIAFPEEGDAGRVVEGCDELS